jgi:hypothetical protein
MIEVDLEGPPSGAMHWYLNSPYERTADPGSAGRGTGERGSVGWA